MADKHLLCKLANGVKIFYPEVTCDDDLLIVPDHRLNKMPAADIAESRSAYSAWLADYLFNATVELDKTQLAFASAIDKKGRPNASSLGDHAVFFEDFVVSEYVFPDNFAAVPDIASVKPMIGGADPYKSYCEEITADGDRPEMSREEYILEDYRNYLTFMLAQADQEQYWSDAIVPPDAPWRIYLSVIVKKIADEDGRGDAINEFYDCYFEAD